MSAAIASGALFGFFAFVIFFRPVVALAFVFILFTFVWRSISTSYIDMFGPVLADQLQRYIGPGNMILIHAPAYVLTMLPLLWFINPRRAPRDDVAQSDAGWITIADAVFLFSLVLVIGLYGDMARRGVVPLLSRMERFDYTGNFAGPLHGLFIKYGNLIVGAWGIFFAAQQIRANRTDWRFVFLLVALWGYMFLAGNRFSIFYSYSSYFLMPYAAVLWARSDQEVKFSGKTVSFVTGLGLIVASTSAYAIYNNLVYVRASDLVAPMQRFTERVLIQPSEIGWVSYERIFLNGQWDPSRAIRWLFDSPINPTTNTTAQYLMLQTIGEPRTALHIGGGFQFAGGFPEIFFELFGPVWAWPFLLLCGLGTAVLTALLLESIIRRHILTALTSMYVLYAFHVMYIGGLMTWWMPTTFWIKVAALLIVAAIERHTKLSFPWRIVSKPALGRFAGFKWRPVGRA